MWLVGQWAGWRGWMANLDEQARTWLWHYLLHPHWQQLHWAGDLPNGLCIGCFLGLNILPLDVFRATWLTSITFSMRAPLSFKLPIILFSHSVQPLISSLFRYALILLFSPEFLSTHKIIMKYANWLCWLFIISLPMLGHFPMDVYEHLDQTVSWSGHSIRSVEWVNEDNEDLHSFRHKWRCPSVFSTGVVVT